MNLKLKKFQLLFVIFILKYERNCSGQELNYLEVEDRLENSTAPKCTFPIENSNITVNKVLKKLKIQCNDLFDGEILDLIEGCESPYVKKLEIIGCNISNTITIRNITDKLTIKNIDYLNFECKSNNSLLKHQLSELNELEKFHYTGPLSSDIFDDLGNITALNLNIDIRSIEEKTLFHLPKLAYLWIRPVPKSSVIYNDTNITLPANIFRNQAKLISLDLTKNNITSLSAATFFNLVSLIHLDLSSNKLRIIPKKLFKSMVNLATLDLNDNQIKRLHDETFRYNVKLVQLHLERNQLDFDENSTIFEKTSNLMNILLQNNSITTFPSKLNGKISSLDLSYNKLKELNLNIPSLPSSISDEFELIVTGNNLSKIPAVNISSTREFSVHAGNNSISELLIDHLPEHLKSLDVSYNLIKKIDLMLLERSKTMRKFEIEGNPLKPQKCNCELLKVVENYFSEADFESFRCANGFLLAKQRKLCSTSKTPDTVEESHWMMGTMIAAILITLASIFGYIYRKNIKHQTIGNQLRVYFLNKKDTFERRYRRDGTTIPFDNMDHIHDIKDFTTLMNSSEASSHHSSLNIL